MLIKFYYSSLLLLGNLKKIFFIGKYKAGKNFTLYATGGIIGDRDKINIGNNVVLHGWLISDGGKITIEDNTSIQQRTIVRSMNKITIGKYCKIGSDCCIQDHNSMSINHLQRRKGNGNVVSAPIVIGDDVWIGRRATVLKGVKIGDRAIIGACAVVVKNVAEGATAVGNPAQEVKKCTKI